ncbi:MAG: hypothetical protein OXI43_02675 [Candidatus Poribacteria bacterium]|nr:hypothetical protein [Candidatus Poribacteria bacterium]
MNFKRITTQPTQRRRYALAGFNSPLAYSVAQGYRKGDRQVSLPLTEITMYLTILP